MDKENKRSASDDARTPLPGSDFDAFDTPPDPADAPTRFMPEDGSAPPPLSPPLPAPGLANGQALDDSAFEPETVFDADSRDGVPAPRELIISPERTVYAPEIGDVLNERFEIRRLLAVGVLGVVYLVHDLRLKSEKALKLMHPSLLEDPSAAERFIGEIKMLQKLSHENIVRVYDYGKTDKGGHAFFTMEYVEGSTLASLLKKKGGRLPFDKGMAIIIQVLNTLVYAHRHAAHRNLKPVNILVRPNGKIVLLNFGLSGTPDDTRTDRGAALANAYYQAPEQVHEPATATPQVDVYAVGVLLYQLLTGEVPLASAPPPSRVNRALPRRLDRVIMRCLAPRPEDRYASAAEARDALQRAMAPRRALPLLVAALIFALVATLIFLAFPA